MKPSTNRLAAAATVGGVAGFLLAFLVGPDVAFSLAALAAGFGTAAWAGAILLAESIRRMQDTLDTASDWTEAGARQAFALLATTGAAGMLGASLAAFL